MPRRIRVREDQQGAGTSGRTRWGPVHVYRGRPGGLIVEAVVAEIARLASGLRRSAAATGSDGRRRDRRRAGWDAAIPTGSRLLIPLVLVAAPGSGAALVPRPLSPWGAP